MKTLVWIVAWIGVTLWSGLCYLVYLAVSVGGRYAANNADQISGDPQMVEDLNWLMRIGTNVGEWVIIVMWLLVALVILGVAKLITSLIKRASDAGSVPIDQ